MMFFGGIAEIVEDHAGLHASNAADGIDLEDPRHVPGEIEDDGNVAALAGERGASATAEQRRSELAAERYGGENVVDVAGKNHADGNLAVVGTVRRVECAGSGIKAYVAGRAAANLGAQACLQPHCVHLR